mmetsp:Transcript_15699/g.21126  ORF Transcript_15699/g.21126 Transcript_15699/m.21126 type:complete len:125 (+) Transcript_15699:817-1191(+)
MASPEYALWLLTMFCIMLVTMDNFLGIPTAVLHIFVPSLTTDLTWGTAYGSRLSHDVRISRRKDSPESEPKVMAAHTTSSNRNISQFFRSSDNFSSTLTDKNLGNYTTKHSGQKPMRGGGMNLA